MVDDVFVDRYIVKDYFPDREEAGTPNIPGAIALATALEVLERIGMDYILEDETILIEDALERMKQIPDIVIYGETDCNICPRAGSISPDCCQVMLKRLASKFVSMTSGW